MNIFKRVPGSRMPAVLGAPASAGAHLHLSTYQTGHQSAGRPECGKCFLEHEQLRVSAPIHPLFQPVRNYKIRVTGEENAI